MSLIISGDVLGAKGYEEKIFYISDKKIKGYLNPNQFFKAAKEIDFLKLTEGQREINQALENYILNLGGEIPDGMVFSGEILKRIDFSKEKPVEKKKSFIFSKKDEKPKTITKKKFTRTKERAFKKKFGNSEEMSKFIND